MSTTFGLHRALQFGRDGIATQFEDRQRTWAEVGNRVARLAGALQRLNVGRGDRIAILMLNQDRYFELYLAIDALPERTFQKRKLMGDPDAAESLLDYRR
jgi:long-chain acyl-CoA synthetase